ncbi:MAG: hypothetical protein INH02_16140 [Gemmatimonas sp.]|uniref:hypothetical protein n=1 Tax=Gemmatimonas sp. TaxID=1962908 RepID=UPI0025C6BF4F|nr:hypothetical protein [Gemmatimonas sp.]MCA2988943.1 hypothetical protein [Gemmatimonas sp.]
MNNRIGFFVWLLVFIASVRFGYVTRRLPRTISSPPHWLFVAGLAAVMAGAAMADEWWEKRLLVVAFVGCVCYAAFSLRHRWTVK